MSKNQKLAARLDSGLVEVKSKFDAEFRRFSVNKETSSKFEEFYALLEKVHQLQNIPFVIGYTDSDGDLLPINNDDNFLKALTTARPILRLLIQRKGQAYDQLNGYGTTGRKKTAISKFMGNEAKARTAIPISFPEDFRRVSAIIDVDAIPETHRRVRLMKNGSDKPLGFYIRDGTSVRVMPHGLEKVPGIFISRLVPGGLAESTGLLAVNDEVLEVNGIEVAGKTLDQVTDMMVANSSNLIITVKPVNQRNNISPKRGTLSRVSQKSVGSHASAQSGQSFDSDDVKEYPRDDDDEDDVHDHINNVQKENSSSKDSSSASHPSEDGTGKVEEKTEESAGDKDNGVVTL